MLVIRPIQDKEYQKELCEKANIEYFQGSMAYVAGLSDDLGDSLSTEIGVLQFDIKGDFAELMPTASLPGIDDTEAMIIMERAAITFIYRNLGIKKLVAKTENTSEELIKAFGIPEKDGHYEIDLELFFKSPCHFGK